MGRPSVFKPLLPALLWVLFRPAFACNCPAATPEELKEQATLIFSGTATDITRHKDTGQKTVDFDVIDFFKGAPKSEVKVTDVMAGTDCDLQIAEKENFLVYARWEWGNLVTSRCAGTKKIEQAEPDAKVIGPGDEWKSKLYPKLKQGCMGHDGAFCCLKSVDSMAEGGFLPESEGGCPSGMAPERLKCGGSMRWCVPATEPVKRRKGP